MTLEKSTKTQCHALLVMHDLHFEKVVKKLLQDAVSDSKAIEIMINFLNPASTCDQHYEYDFAFLWFAK